MAAGSVDGGSDTGVELCGVLSQRQRLYGASDRQSAVAQRETARIDQPLAGVERGLAKIIDSEGTRAGCHFDCGGDHGRQAGIASGISLKGLNPANRV